MQQVIALFGESEKGKWDAPHFIKSLPGLIDVLGSPPPNSQGLFFAIQTLLYKRELVYFRVQEEGFSKGDYLFGLNALKNTKKFQKIHAVCMPGVGDQELLDVSFSVCAIHKTQLIMTEKDLYDYLTF